MPAPKFQVQVPVDASGIQGIRPDQKVRVVAQDAAGNLQSAVVQLDAKGQGTAALGFDRNPGTLRIALGPENAGAEDILGMQTLETRVPGRLLIAGRVVKLPAVKVSPIFWEKWWKFCRTFVVHGQVVCPNGQAVPGAKVCVYDVDYWWWWGSTQLVGCATTDANGSFTLKFKWCCGYLPWWWWARRTWQLEPGLADHILPLLQGRSGSIVPSPMPDLSVFHELLGASPDAPMPHGAETAAAAAGARIAVDPTALTGLRDRLVGERRLPASVSVIDKLKLWPWYPWQPWFDCSPDLIFRVTQDCITHGNVIVSEGFDDVRWNVPTSLNVTLVANDKACCVQIPPDEPDDPCVLMTNVCGIPINQIGGNPGAPAAPVGYASGDRPFGEAVQIAGQLGDVDYYQFEWSNGGPWSLVPDAAAGGFSRQYWEPPSTFVDAAFPLDTVDGRKVFESRRHYEAANNPASWGVTRFWMAQEYFTLMYWQTLNIFSDDTYRLRVRGFKRVGNDLVNEIVLPLCATSTEARVVLRIDNRFVGGLSGHPTALDHPCGGGTIHTCTTEPDTDIIAVRINGTSVGACDLVDAKAGGSLEIDFLAHDPDAHLAVYSLIATYGENLAIDLLGVAGATLTPAPGASGVPPALQVGPAYGNALAQGAVRPHWAGGCIRLTIPDLKKAFPKTCCYQLELRAYKRTIVGCYMGYGHANLSEYSFMVVV